MRDGWRLDVAADLGCSNEYNHMFWKRFRKEVKRRQIPEAFDPGRALRRSGREWLQGDEWDSVMNYDAFITFDVVLTGMEKHSDERRTDLWGNADNFIGGMRHFMASMLTPSFAGRDERAVQSRSLRFLTRTKSHRRTRRTCRCESCGRRR